MSGKGPPALLWRGPRAGSGESRAYLTVLSESDLQALFGGINEVRRQGVHSFKSSRSWARARTEAGRIQEQGGPVQQP